VTVCADLDKAAAQAWPCGLEHRSTLALVCGI